VSLAGFLPLGHGFVALTSHGRVGGIGSGQSGRASSQSWFLYRSGCDRTPVHQSGRDLGGAESRRVT
jgi:hypothetical protein